MPLMTIVTRTYHGCGVTAWMDPEGGPYPWRFGIRHKGKAIRFIGIPNQCETARQALKRAWYRAKWLADGTFDKHYGK